MDHFIWMIERVREVVIHHVGHHSYLLEAMGWKESFHSHFPPLIDVDHLVLHTWEETLDDSLFADYLDAMVEAIYVRPQEAEGRNLIFLYIFLRTSKDFVGEDCNVPKF